MITPTRGYVTIGQLNSRIKGIKNALKQRAIHGYELRMLKRSLREAYAEHTDLNRGNDSLKILFHSR